ncbi:DMT family transporter [Pseudooceanicola sp. CBS1P-1]|uniref:EamA family transporter n=1 Tax=Pseudooceanicola albus TaxID=2692189 RepID=A0A6L7G233_9RHOB|nr:MULTISPECIES: DMT family transporter [Pseudooceanicola]MBT9383944.1 DMT family transporter [Pseudooceanicola endophyticus]MXN16643.1 EamA family transporter [Pseudooceanicola albus]
MDFRAILMGTAFALMWSSAFTSARIIVQHAPPMGSLALRFLISGLIALALARAMGQSLRLSRAQWRSTVIFGVCQNALYLGLFFIAMQWIEASLATILASTMPLMVGLIGWLVMGQKLRPMAIAGLVLGLIGVAIIMGSRLEGGAEVKGVALCLVGALALSIATLSARGASSGGNVMAVVGYQMLVGSGVLAVTAWAFEPWQVSWTPGLIGAFAFTVLVPGVAATWLWFVLVGRIGAVKAATFHFLNPFFGVLVAALVLGEHVGPVDLLGVAIVAAGILAVQLAKQPPAPMVAARADVR